MGWRIFVVLILVSSLEAGSHSKDLPPQLQIIVEEIVAGKYLNALLNILHFQSTNIWTKDLFNEMMARQLQNSAVISSNLQDSVTNYFQILLDNPKVLLSVFQEMSPKSFQMAMKYLFGRTQKYLELGNVRINLHRLRERLFQSPGGNRTLFLVTLEKCFLLLSPAECVDILSHLLRESSATYFQAHHMASFPQDFPKDVVQNLSVIFKDLYDRLTANTKKAVYNWITLNLQNSYNASDSENSTSWVSAENLWILGRYMVHLSLEEIRNIHPNEMRLFVSYDNATKQLDMVYDITPGLAQGFLERIDASGFDRRNVSTLYRLGLLVCFYHDLEETDSITARVLLHQMIKCHQLRGFQANIRKLKFQLLEIAMQNQTLNDSLGSLSDAVVGLTTSQLEFLSPGAVHQAISTLNQVSSWAESQMIILACKYLLYEKALSFRNVTQMGVLVTGIDTQSFYSMNPKELSQGVRGALDQRFLQLSPAQRQGIFQKIMGSSELSFVLANLHGAFFHEVSLLDLRKGDPFNMSLVAAKDLRRSQALFLFESLSKTTRFSDLLSGQLAKGLTCRHIERLSAIAFLNNFSKLEKNLHLLSPYQINCLAWKFWTVSKESVPSYLLSMLPVRFLDSLARSRCVSFVTYLGKTDFEKLIWNVQKEKAILRKVLDCLNSSLVDEYTIEWLGNLNCHLSPSFLGQGISPDAMAMLLRQYGQCQHLSHEQKMEIKEKLIELYGSPRNWTAETVQDNGPFIALLPKAEITVLVEKFPDFISEVVSKTSGPVPPTKNLLLAQFESLCAARTPIRAFDLTPDCEGVTAPSTDEIFKLSEANMFWSAQELSCMESGTFDKTVEILGSLQNLDTLQLAVLKEKAKQVWGLPESWKRYHIVSLGRIVTALNKSEIGALDLSSVDTVAALSRQRDWNLVQAKSILQGFLDDSGQAMASLKSFDLAGLGHILCTLNSTEIASINATEFGAVAARIGSLLCSSDVLRGFKKKVESVFGTALSWDPAILQEVGTIAAGLNEEEFKALDRELMVYFHPTAIQLIPNEIFKVLSPEQIANLGPENAAMVTDSQRQQLNEQQLQALRLALDGDRRDIQEVLQEESPINPIDTSILNGAFSPCSLTLWVCVVSFLHLIP